MNIHPIRNAQAYKAALRELSEYFDHEPEPVVITRNARPAAVMLSIEAYERLVEAVPDPLAR